MNELRASGFWDMLWSFAFHHRFLIIDTKWGVEGKEKAIFSDNLF